MRKIVTLHIHCFKDLEVKGPEYTMKQIFFDGKATGDYFNGEILPGGIDTQIIYPDGSGELSARYFLDGIDCEGQQCRIYVDNRAKLNCLDTTPVLTTDSKALVWVNGAKLKGRMIFGEEFLIEISEAEEA